MASFAKKLFNIKNNGGDSPSGGGNGSEPGTAKKNGDAAGNGTGTENGAGGEAKKPCRLCAACKETKKKMELW